MRITPASLTGLLMITACASPPPAVDTAAAKTALEAAARQYGEVAKTKDIEAFLSWYASDATMYPPSAPTATGLEAIRAVGNSFLQDPAFAGTFRPVSAMVANSGDLGYTLDDAQLTATGPDGKPLTERLRDFHVWRREADGKWKIVIDIWNAEPPAPVAAPAPTTK